MRKVRLGSTKVKLKSVTGLRLKVVGTVYDTINHMNQSKKMLIIVVEWQ